MDRVGGKRASRRSRCQEPETAVPGARGGEVEGHPASRGIPAPGMPRPRGSRPAEVHKTSSSSPPASGPPRSPPRTQAPWRSSPSASSSTCPPRASARPGPLRMFSPGLAMVPPSLPASPVSSSPASCFDPDGRPSQPSPCPAGHRRAPCLLQPASAQGGDAGSCLPGIRSLPPGDSQTPLRPPVLSQALERAQAGDGDPGLGRTHGTLPEASPREGRWPVWPQRSQTGEEHPGGPRGVGSVSTGPGQPLATPEGRPLQMPLNCQKLNLLLLGNFCKVRGLNSPEVFA